MTMEAMVKAVAKGPRRRLHMHDRPIFLTRTACSARVMISQPAPGPCPLRHGRHRELEEQLQEGLEELQGALQEGLGELHVHGPGHDLHDHDHEDLVVLLLQEGQEGPAETELSVPGALRGAKSKQPASSPHL